MITIDLEKNNKILIIGYPQTGKTTIFNSLEAPNHVKISIEEKYKDFSFVEQLYELIKDIKNVDKWIIEGTQGFRLLRKYAQKGWTDLKPDLIILCKTSNPIKDEHKGYAKALDTIFLDYVNIEPHLPKIREVWDYNG